MLIYAGLSQTLVPGVGGRRRSWRRGHCRAGPRATSPRCPAGGSGSSPPPCRPRARRTPQAAQAQHAPTHSEWLHTSRWHCASLSGGVCLCGWGWVCVPCACLVCVCVCVRACKPICTQDPTGHISKPFARTHTQASPCTNTSTTHTHAHTGTHAHTNIRQKPKRFKYHPALGNYSMTYLCNHQLPILSPPIHCSSKTTCTRFCNRHWLALLGMSAASAPKKCNNK